MSVRHYVNPEPFDPAEVERLSPDQERFYTASQWQLMWWKFRRHKMALVGAGVVLGLYLVAIFVEPLAPYDPEQQDVRFAYHLAESTRGRVFFTAGRELDRYVVWDYVARRKQIIS